MDFNLELASNAPAATAFLFYDVYICKIYLDDRQRLGLSFCSCSFFGLAVIVNVNITLRKCFTQLNISWAGLACWKMNFL